MKFKPEDFWTDSLDDYETPEIFAESMASIANARLKEMLADAPVVTSETHLSVLYQSDWSYRPGCAGKSYDTHKALLVCIEKFEKPKGVEGE